MKNSIIGRLMILIMIPSISQSAPLDVYGQYPDCNAPAIPAEVYSLWKEPGEEFPRILSTATCLPNARDVNGPLLPDKATFWVRSMTYNNPGDVTYVRHQWTKGGAIQKIKGDPRDASNCLINGYTGLEECTWFDQLTITTDGMSADMDELRISTDIRHRDLRTRQYTTLNLMLRKQPEGTQYRSSSNLKARAWYSSHDYVRVIVNYEEFIGEGESIPTVSGVVPLKIKQNGGEYELTSVGWENVDFHKCPDLLARDVKPGEVVPECGNASESARKLYEKSGEWGGTYKWDTTHLQDGVHAIYLLTQDAEGNGATSAGAIKLLFNVQNGAINSLAPPEPALEPEPAPEPDPVPQPEPAPEPDPVPQPEPAPEPDPVPQPEPAPEPDPVPQPEPAPEPDPVPQPEPVLAPTVNLSADPSTTSANGITMLSWFASNADACIASGDWSGSKGTSGSEQIGSLSADATFKLSCTGEGGQSTDSVTVKVEPLANGTASLSWTPPTRNEDGSVLADLAGYEIGYGVKAGDYPNVIRIDNPGITSYVIENLSPNTYYFVIRAVDSLGDKSDPSNMVSKTIP